MKIAVCFSGQIRTFDYCKESILQFFPNCDFFCHTYDYTSYHEGPGLDDVEPTDITKNKINLVKETLNPKSFKLTTREESEKLFKSFGWDGKENMINCYSMFYSICESLDNDFSEYDVVVKTRYDLVHTFRHTIEKFVPKKIQYLLNSEIPVRFFIDDLMDVKLENPEFPINDVQWVFDTETATLIKNYRDVFKKGPTEYPNNKHFMNYILKNAENINLRKFRDYDMLLQSWQIVRPRHIKRESNWKSLINTYKWIY